MKRFKFILETGAVFDCIALSFRAACVSFDNARLDPRTIVAIEER